jgi:hypothetical protein
MVTACSSLSTWLVWANLMLAVQQWQNLQIVFILMVLFGITVKFPDIKIIKTTETVIKSKIRSLKSKYSSGYDERTSTILKACSALIISPHL